MLYYKECFAELRKTGSSSDVTSIAKTLGKQWRALTDDERTTYNKNARTQAIGSDPVIPAESV